MRVIIGASQTLMVGHRSNGVHRQFLLLIDLGAVGNDDCAIVLISSLDALLDTAISGDFDIESLRRCDRCEEKSTYCYGEWVAGLGGE